MNVTVEYITRSPNVCPKSYFAAVFNWIPNPKVAAYQMFTIFSHSALLPVSALFLKGVKTVIISKQNDLSVRYQSKVNDWVEL